jgi:hypothetical protein
MKRMYQKALRIIIKGLMIDREIGMSIICRPCAAVMLRELSMQSRDSRGGAAILSPRR